MTNETERIPITKESVSNLKPGDKVIDCRGCECEVTHGMTVHHGGAYEKYTIFGMIDLKYPGDTISTTYVVGEAENGSIAFVDEEDWAFSMELTNSTARIIKAA